MWQKFWNDEDGAVVTIEYVLIGTICGIGVITGLTSLRDGVITELADLGGAVAALNQSYVIGGTSSHCSWNGASQFNDLLDFCDDTGVGNEGNSRCLVVCEEAQVPGGEGATGPI